MVHGRRTRQSNPIVHRRSRRARHERRGGYARAVARLLLLLMSLAWVRVAGATPLQLLLDPWTAPPVRDEALGEACAADPPTADELAGFFVPETPRPVLIDGARLFACHPTPELVPVAWSAFLRAKAGALTTDPDHTERIARALGTVPRDVLRDALTGDLAGAAHGRLLDLAWDRLVHDWLGPLTNGAPPRRPATLDAADAASRWLDAVLDAPDGVLRLQSDSGDHAHLFFSRLQGWHLAALLRTGSPEEARLAADVCQQSGLCDRTARDALAARLTAAPDPPLEALLPRLPEHRDEVAEIAGPTFPDPVVEVAEATGETLADVRWRPSLLGLALLALAGFWGGWLASARRREDRRPLFRLGAVALAPTLLVVAEALLALAGVAPLAATERSGWSEPLALRAERAGEGLLLARDSLEGADGASDWWIPNNPGARWAPIPVEEPPGAWRIAVLGESSAQGAAELREGIFASHLGRRIAARHPERRVDVIYGGVGGAISDDVLAAGRDALAAGADVLVLYHGINDLGRLEVLASMRAFSPLQLAVRVLLDESRVVRMLSALVPDVVTPPDADGARPDDGDGEAPPSLARFAALRCSRNQQRLVRLAAEQGVPTVVVIQALSSDPRFLPGPDDRERVRSIAERTAARTGVPLVDGPALLARHNGGEPPGAPYFWDQVHPAPLGHAVLGEGIAPTVERVLLESADPTGP